MILCQCDSSSLNNSNNAGMHRSKQVMTLFEKTIVLHKFVKPLHNLLEIHPSAIVLACFIDLYYTPSTLKLCWQNDPTFETLKLL